MCLLDSGKQHEHHFLDMPRFDLMTDSILWASELFLIDERHFLTPNSLSLVAILHSLGNYD
jgi:hypothetical protein